MRFGIHLRELSRRRVGVALSALVAIVAAIYSVANISLAPPQLKPRALQTATAYTQVMVDTPKSSLLDLGVNADVISTMTSRALLVANLMATQPVVAYISHRVGVPADNLQIEAPSTPGNPQPRSVPGRSNGPTDLVRSPNQYRLDIFADPIVPYIDVYAQAPTASAAAQLANGAVVGLSDYMQAVAASQRTPLSAQVQLRQFGRAEGKVINKSVNLQMAVLTFLVVFGAGCAATIALGRIRRGWRLAASAAQQ